LPVVGTCTWKRMVVFSLFLIRHKVGNPWYCKLALGIHPQKKKKTNFICSNWIFASMKFVVCGERTQNFHNPVQFDPNWSKVTIWSPLSGHWLWLRQHGCGWPVGQWLITAKALIGVKTSLKESHRQLETMQTNGDNWHPWSGP
jgi:hypothetical protein